MNQVQRQLAIGTIAVVVLTAATVLQTPSVETELQAAPDTPILGFASLGAIGSTVTAVQSVFESVPPRHWQEQITQQQVQTTVERHGNNNVSVALSRSQYRVQFNGIQPDWDRTPTVTSRRGFNGMHDFVWVDSNNFSDTERYDARVTLPDTYDRVYRCEGTADSPDCFTIDRHRPGMDRPYYRVVDGETVVYMNQFSGAGGTQTQILKPTNHNDEGGRSGNLDNAYDNTGEYDESTRSTTEVGRGHDPSVRFNTWDTTDKEDYDKLSLSVTVALDEGTGGDEWGFFYTTDGTSCDSTDNAVVARTSDSPSSPTNYTTLISADQDLSQLEVCITEWDNGGDAPDLWTYDIRTNGTYTLETPPFWRNQQQNVSTIKTGGAVELAAQGNDTDGLDHAVLATDETGTWENKTGSYGSPMSLGTTNEWTWSNFTWVNPSITDQTVQWKIYYNNTDGNWNVTDTLAFTVDSTPPSITIYDPTGIVGTDTPWLNVTADEAVDTWLYNVDGGSNSTFAPNITLSSLTEGDHTVNVYANDSVNNVGKTSQSFTVDTTPPALDYNPSATGAGIHTQNWIFVNVTATDATSGLDFVRETFDGTNSTVATNSGDHWWENHTGLSDGSYTVQAWANDSAGHYTFTSERSITLDTTPPSTKDNWTVSGWQSQSSAFIELTSSDTTASVDRISYRVDGGTWTTSTGSSTTLTISGDGNHTLEYNATDTAGNQETTQIEYVALDTTAPIITVHSPENTTYTEDSVPLGVTAKEGVDTWTYSLDAGSNNTFTPNITLTGLSDGQHDVVVSANDSVGNTGSARHVFTVDTTPATWVLLVEQTQDTFRREHEAPDEPSGWSKWN